MNDRLAESQEALSYAREALKNGATMEARQWAERSAKLAPESEDAWLVLAAVADPHESLEYARKALEINPSSPRAQKGMQWAMSRVSKESKNNADRSAPSAEQPANISPKPQAKKRSRLLPILLTLTGIAALAFAAWSAVNSPVLASIMQKVSPPEASQPAEGPHFARVSIAKPQAAAPVVVINDAPIAQAATPTSMPTASPVPTATEAQLAAVIVTDSSPAAQSQPAAVIPTQTKPAPTAVIQPTNTAIVAVIPSSTTAALETVTAAVTEVPSTPGSVLAEIVADTPTPEGGAVVVSAPEVPIGTGNGGERWIDVNLSQQRVYAYEGDTLINSFVVSTGTWQTPTVTGKYKIWIKLRSTDMSGPGYYLPDVPFTMYFYKGYGLHGTYWHNNFGTPMSHGCVNLSTPDAEWLYNFSSVGTVVNVHY